MMRSSDNNTENEVRYVLASALTLVLAACASYPAPPSVALPSQVPDAIEAQLVQIGRIIDPPRTAALYAPLQLRGHSHMSEVYAINTADSALGDAIRGFVFGRR